MNRKKKIVAIGGGTGTYSVLKGLKDYPVDLSVIVSMTDSGGSNRVIRDEFGLLPTSDLRQCIVALASEDSNKSLRELFTYRYNAGTGISGMTFGNLFMAALTDIHKTQEGALKKTCELLDVKGEIIPVTYDNTNLVARYDHGKQVLGEHHIDEADEDLGNHRIVELEVFPRAKANPKAIKAIREADLIVLGPGDLYTSIISNLVVGNVAKAVRESKAKRAYIVNLMTRFGQTNGFTVSDHTRELERYLGLGSIDVVLINKTKKYPRGVLSRYKEEHAYPVKDDLGKTNNLKVIRKSFVSNKVYQKPISDKLTRSLIRHDPKKTASAIISIL
jgi:uncharacterized cofD-like protein